MRSLSRNGSGQEIKLEEANNNNNNKFYLARVISSA